MARTVFAGHVSGAVSSAVPGVSRDLQLSVPERSFVSISSPTAEAKGHHPKLVPQAITPVIIITSSARTAKPG